MKTQIAIITLVGSALAFQGLSSQALAQMDSATKEHEWLQKFVGQWDVVSEGSAGEDQASIEGKASMKSSMLGKLWLVNSSDMEVGGMKITSVQMIGFDPKKKKYVGIWADSMINYMWQYEGTLDEAGKKLTLNAEGPSMEGDGKMRQYRDQYEFKDKDTIIATSSVQGEDGKWTVMMTGTAKRRK